MIAVKDQHISGSAYEVALESAMSDLAQAQTAISNLRKALAIAEANARDTRELIDQLVRRLAPGARAIYEARLAVLQSSTYSGRGTTTTYQNVVELFLRRSDKEWSAPDVYKELKANGIPSDPDQIHNVFQYLARKGRLRRVSRGRYEVIGYGVGIEGDPEGGYQ